MTKSSGEIIAIFFLGIFKHSQSMSRTLLADITSQMETASIFGSFNSMSSLGFIVGPAIGGILASSENGFFLVAVLSSSIFVLNACLVYSFVPLPDVMTVNEKKDSIEKEKEEFKLDLFSSFNAFRNMTSIPWNKMWKPFTIKFLFAIAIILFRSNFSSILAYRFNVDTKTNGFIMSFNGIVSAIGSALVRWISPHFRTNDSLHNTFSIILVLSLALITAAPTLNVVIVAIVPLCLASSVLRVTNSIAIYQKGDGQAKGFLIGLSDTLTSLSRALGPAIAGFAQEMSIYGPGSCAVFFGAFATSIGFISVSKKLHTE